MLIKVNGEYLDFDEEIEIERQVKLFDDISGIAGDYSYSFSIPNTSENRKKLQLNDINTTFPYTVNDAELENNSGVTLYRGFLRIEGRTDSINASFFSNNSNWFDILNDNIRDFKFTTFDTNVTSSIITGSWTKSSGVVFPLVNKGALHNRRDAIVYEEDMQPFIYVKDVIKTLLAQRGLKLSGDILRDSIYNQLITSNNSLSGVQDRITARTSKVGKSSSQTVSSTSFTKVTFTNTSGVYYNSPNNNWDTVQSTYVCDIDYKRLNVEVFLRIATGAGYIQILLNTSEVFNAQLGPDFSGSQKSYTFTKEIINVFSGDVITVNVRRVAPSANIVILTDSFVTVTPIKFLKLFADQITPDIRANEYISQIFRLFNVVTNYDVTNKTIKTTLFKNIKNNPEIDLSDYLESYEENYTDFINDYSKNNYLKYSEASDTDTETYNNINTTPYGAGNIQVNNDYLEDESDLFELDFVSSFQKNVSWLGNKLPLLNYVEDVETSDTKSITSVSDNGAGFAEFNFSGSNPFIVNQLVRVKDSTISEYDGTYRVIAVGVSNVLLNLAFAGTATGTLVGISLDDIDSDDQTLLINSPSQLVTNFSNSRESINYDGASTIFTFALAYFYLDNNLLPINNNQKEALYFDRVTTESPYQVSLKEKYYKEAIAMLNNPYTIRCIMTLPETVFNSLDSTRPIRIRTDKFNSLFYLNKITGYNGSHMPCEVELIKLS